ncbi:MAG: glycoside hydrolase family 3 C-terminal domain-containing protein [Candidatus Hodarchaeales archaeon]
MGQQIKKYMDQKEPIEDRVKDLLSRLTLDEKIKLLAGNRFFQTHSIKRLGIKPFKMTDGPLGVSAHSSLLKRNTLFPGGISLASSWNRDLVKEFGKAVGDEVRATGRHALLAPGMNIDRSPLNGRTFEYFSEDPYLTKEIAIPFVNGVQDKGIAACIKHYFANNQELDRFTISSEIEERTLHEIYLRAYMQVIEEADPWMLMTSYNKVNGKYPFADKSLLNDLLLKWNFSGFVVSDWSSLARSDPPVLTSDCVKAGLTLEMPKADKYHPEQLKNELKDGEVTEKDLDFLLTNLLRVMFRVGLFNDKKTVPKGSRNTKQHQELARQIAEESIVLLKNEKDILPLDSEKINTLAIVGPNSKKRFGGLLYGGSSGVKPPYEITTFEGIKEKCSNKIQLTNDLSSSDYVIIVAGLNHDNNRQLTGGGRDKKTNEILYGHDSEGTDRSQLELPEEQIVLIKETIKINPNVIVILLNGSPLSMSDWLDEVPVVLEAWYPGMEGGRAIANILFGEISPSGKLPITFPNKIKDSPAHQSTRTFPGVNLKVYYEEGIFVGYRYFDQQGINPLFPFGYGLTYTSFSYSQLTLNKSKVTDDDEIVLSVTVTNTGERSGSEVVQVYFQQIESSVERPPKELIGFEKVYLSPQESKIVSISINPKDLAFYDVQKGLWKLEKGSFKLMVGSSSRDIHLDATFEYLSRF